MKHLINLSVHSTRFGPEWAELPAYLEELGADGAELLVGYQPPSDPSPGLVGVHLPILIAWLDAWFDRWAPPFEDAALRRAMWGGTNREELIESQAATWAHAAALNPAYGVFHVSHVTAEETYRRRYAYSDEAVIDAAADLLNAAAATFESNEPPLRLALENLWWPGLTFRRPEITARLIERLAFDNWCFALDTGHLLNTEWGLESEEEALTFLIEHVEAFPEFVRERIEVVHLNLSLSGAYQRETPHRLPDGWPQMDFRARFNAARQHVLNIDRHQPFTHPRTADLLAAISPVYVNHELMSADREDYAARFRQQLAAVG